MSWKARMGQVDTQTVIATTNGHPWIRAFGMTCCRDCGMVRRADDKNKPCRGVVRVGPREEPAEVTVRRERDEEWRH